MDNINWQSTNSFPNLPRGVYTIYVKDTYNCTPPVQASVTVPNIVNVITPNGDGINDVIDYSALSSKKDLTFAIYDRYGAKIYQADKDNGYKWDGTVAGKKLTTGTYWYSVSWKENTKQETPTIFSGWILLKNRE
jgi:gliding motility-associated-like protein